MVIRGWCGTIPTSTTNRRFQIRCGRSLARFPPLPLLIFLNILLLSLPSGRVEGSHEIVLDCALEDEFRMPEVGDGCVDHLRCVGRKLKIVGRFGRVALFI